MDNNRWNAQNSNKIRSRRKNCCNLSTNKTRPADTVTLKLSPSKTLFWSVVHVLVLLDIFMKSASFNGLWKEGAFNNRIKREFCMHSKKSSSVNYVIPFSTFLKCGKNYSSTKSTWWKIFKEKFFRKF